MNNLSRPTALKIAAVISFLLSAYSVIFSVPIVTQGAAAVNQNPESIPFEVALIGLIAGVVGIVAAYGAWKLQRWGIILTIVINLVNALSAAPGLLFAPTPELRISAIAGVIGSSIIIILCLWRERKTVTA